MSIVNAKIQTVSTDGRAYVQDNGIKRGDPKFVMSRSHLKEVLNNAARWLAGYNMEKTAQTEWGNLMDVLVTDHEHFDQRIAVSPATYPGKDKKGNPVEKPWNFGADYCSEWREQQEGKIIAKAHEYSAAEEALQVLFRDEECATIIRHSRKQVCITAEWDEWTSGLKIPLKCLIDIVPDKPFHRCLVDFKTATSGHPRQFASNAFDHGYHMQAALYLDLWNAAANEDRNEFRHIVQESYSPWQVTKTIMSEEFITLGRTAYVSAIQAYCQCIVTGVWPGYKSNTVIDGWNVTEPAPWMATA